MIIALSACTVAPAQDKTVTGADSMQRFARLVGGEWKTAFGNGTTSYHTWHWGPGRYSMRRMEDQSDGFGAWAGEVIYWHPGHKQILNLGMHPDIPAVGRGVSEGTITFEGETAVTKFDLYQPRGRRDMALRTTFDGDDKYRDDLLEATGPEGLKPMNGWNYVRVKERPATQPRAAEEGVAKLPKHLKFFETLLGHTWEARGNSATGNAFHIHSTYELVPSLEVICARVVAPSKAGEPTHLFDVYLYKHVRDGALRCLALSNRGGVYEGDMTMLESGGLQLDLKGYEGDQVVPLVVNLDIEKDGTLRSRVWSVKGTERVIMFDVHRKKLVGKKD